MQNICNTFPIFILTLFIFLRLNQCQLALILFYFFPKPLNSHNESTSKGFTPNLRTNGLYQQSTNYGPDIFPGTEDTEGAERKQDSTVKKHIFKWK